MSTQEQLKPLRVVVADDHEAYRAGIARALETAGIWVVGLAARGDAALALVRELQPDVALLDLRMPGMSGSEIAEAIIEERLPTRVVILSAYSEPELVSDAVRAGVFGYVEKEAPRSHILDAVRRCAHGQPDLPDGSGGLAEVILARPA
jgi:two-component system, NarL family, nitrate/nitrite response regulator NarL